MRDFRLLTRVEDYAMFDDHAIDRMLLEGGHYLPAHLRGICPEHCPICRKEREG